MPAIHTRAFEIRQYECDLYGHLNNANYIRYMQEAALSASAEVGWDIKRYQSIGHQWLIRETEIEFLQQLTYGETVVVTTWVDDFRRVRSRRIYEFRRSGTDELVARALTDWVYINIKTDQPSHIPEVIIRAYRPEGIPDIATRRDKFPQPPQPPVGVFRLCKRVEFRDVDIAGHLNNAAYFTFIEDASTQVGRHFGWPMRRIMDAGFAIIGREIRIEYLRPAFLDDELEIATYVSHVRRATAYRHYLITRLSDGQKLARARILWVWIDLQSGRPIRVPEAFTHDFADNIVSE